MVNPSFRRRLLAVALAMGATLAAPAPLAAQYHTGSTPLYIYYYFSDGTYTDQIGEDRDTCNRWGIGRTATSGSWSPYVQTELWGYCVNGQLRDTPE